jgi:glycosyltransferase involved in cell wall biosynthesis
MSRHVFCFADVRFPLERANGIQTMETCAALARRGCRVSLLVRPDTARPPRDPFDYYGVADAPGLSVERVVVRGPEAVRRAGSLAQALVRAVTSRPDLVLTRDLGFASLYLRWRRRHAAALVYESHGFAPTVSEARPSMLSGARTASAAKQRRLFRREAFVWQNADGYATITRGLADELQDRFGARPALAVVADGARMRRAAPWLFAAGGTDPVVAYSGHLYPWKGVDLLLEALASLPGVRGLIVGGHPAEPDAARLRARSRELGLDSRIVFTGMVAPYEVAARLEAADILVLPNPETPVSARYTSPLKLFEYLAMGRPIVASDLPAFREVLTDRRNALLFEPGSAAALARAIRALLDDRQLAAAIAAGAGETAADYSWDRRAERLDVLFDDACARAAAGRGRSPAPPNTRMSGV